MPNQDASSSTIFEHAFITPSIGSNERSRARPNLDGMHRLDNPVTPRTENEQQLAVRRMQELLGFVEP